MTVTAAMMARYEMLLIAKAALTPAVAIITPAIAGPINRDTLKEIEAMKASYIKEEKKLLEKYGDDVVINVQTGEVKNGNN